MSNHEYEIIISEDVYACLDRHVEFLARVSEEVARKTADSILDDIESLKTLPHRCPAYENEFVPHGRYRKLLSGKRYLVLFEIGDEAVYVDYILDCRQDNK